MQSSNEAFDKKYASGHKEANLSESKKRKLREGFHEDFRNLDWYEQAAVASTFFDNYKGTRVYEDFAKYVGYEADDIIDILASLEKYNQLKVSYEIRKDLEWCCDDPYESTLCNNLNGDTLSNDDLSDTELLRSIAQSRIDRLLRK